MFLRSIDSCRLCMKVVCLIHCLISPFLAGGPHRNTHKSHLSPPSTFVPLDLARTDKRAYFISKSPLLFSLSSPHNTTYKSQGKSCAPPSPPLLYIHPVQTQSNPTQQRQLLQIKSSQITPLRSHHSRRSSLPPWPPRAAPSGGRRPKTPRTRPGPPAPSARPATWTGRAPPRS